MTLQYNQLKLLVYYNPTSLQIVGVKIASKDYKLQS